MKKIFYLSMILAFLGSFTVARSTTFAARPHAAMITVRLCSSAPVGIGSNVHLVQGIWHGLSVATASWRGKFKRAGLNLLAPLTLDDAKSDGSAVDPAKEASNARTCLASSADMGYIGTLNSSMAQVSEPILNRGGMAMISPSNTSPILTNPALRSTYEPLTANGRLKLPTYYRVVTTDSLQGPVGAIFMNQLGYKTFYAVDDQETYGAGLVQKMAAWATGRLGMTEIGSGHIDTSSTAAIATSAAAVARQVVQKNPPALYCGGNEENCAPMLKAARRAGYKGAFLGGDAINDPTFATVAGGVANAYQTYSTTVGDPAATPKSFINLEHKFYKGWLPGPYDALSYAASNVVLAAILKSKNAGTFKGGNFQRRSSILKYIKNGNYSGTIGAFHFDKNGDTSLRELSIYTWHGSDWAFDKAITTNNVPSLKLIAPTP